MKVLSGKARGRHLHSPGIHRIRPTSAKVREAIFHIVGNAIHGASFLDLCAGTGAVGIEAASQGARLVVWVDEDPRAVRLITRNLQGCGLESSEVHTSPALPFLRRAQRKGRSFEVVFVDLPYRARSLLEAVLSFLGTSDILSPGGMLLVEHSVRESMPTDVGHLALAKTYRYGDTALSRYRRQGQQTEATQPS